ncbi:Major facilitator superfamily domain, general substrate transporter [Niveomyces insectorum RCEF 264]|uniref:Major facilitator superfamily domain, general substrate transporter n=1 Tax=Niveomyces insectorum RCEF 264 TaxID=1081102 RepID=A0A167TGW0_9HYPO|nr:Major facilitator superfamily domain, general substrate transporter [Niveomyces insectorum RCEF 264]
MAHSVSDQPSGSGEGVTKSLAAMHVEEQEGHEMTAEEAFVASFPDKKKKKLLLKMDLHIVPILMSLYIMSFIDRANIGNANIVGMSKDLGMTDTQYNTVLSIFFVTYIVFEMPSNYVLGKYFRRRPSWWLGIITLLWGAMMTVHGVVKNYGSLTAVRLLMGLFEAGLFPGAIAVMNNWYTKYELATRFSLFYVGSALSGAFSGLLAYGFEKIDGVGGLPGWSWIFICEGLITVLIGLLTPFLLADTAENATRWLSEEEQRYLSLRMTLQEGGAKIQKASTHFSWGLFLEILKDWQFYVMVFNYWSNTVPTYGMKFTMPAIMKNMGFTNANAQLMTVPPYIAGAISAFVFGRLSDKFKRRSYFIVIPQTLVLIAYAILTPMSPKIKDNLGVCYFGIVLANIGLYPINPGASSWISNNLAGSAKRTLGIAYMTSLTNLGAIGGSFIFIASEAPGYPTGFGVSLTMAGLGIVASVLLDVIYGRINKKRDLVSEDEVREKYTDDELAALGDRSPLFRYTL